MLAQTLMALLLSFSWSILLEQLTQLQLLQNSPFAKQSQYLTESDTEHRKHELWYLLGQFSVVHIDKYSIINCNLEARPSVEEYGKFVLGLLANHRYHIMALFTHIQESRTSCTSNTFYWFFQFY